ncbi:MAG: DUF362 domain-containing protein [Candidatus Bathyarchaeota archaeon]|nr:DUF362 domain-containing protein [Candidatus Bathyarchaeota archaeon]
MIVTSENSLKLYKEMAANPPHAPKLPMKPQHPDPYKVNGKNRVSVVRTSEREKGIRRAVELLGGVKPMLKGVKGMVLIKPNCNTDDPYPRDTHYDTIRTIAELLIEAGTNPENIMVGDMSGRARGLPTRATMENLGIIEVAEDMELNIAYFDEEEWVTVEPTEVKWWPNGLRIPRTVYESERIIFTPILRSHTSATFTCSLKLGVGLIDAEERDWLHNGEYFYEKMMDINLAYQVDMVIADAMKLNTGYSTEPEDEVAPGIITASNNMVASDAVSVALLKHYGTVRVVDHDTRDQTQFELADKLGLGKANLSEMEINWENIAEDNGFQKQLDYIMSELR